MKGLFCHFISSWTTPSQVFLLSNNEREDRENSCQQKLSQILQNSVVLINVLSVNGVDIGF